MKTSTIVMLGLGAVAAYFLLAKKDEGNNYALSGDVPVISTLPGGALQQTIASTIPEATQAVNKAVTSKAQLVGTSKTLYRGVDATINRTGQRMTGNVAILGGQKNPSFIGVSQPARDSSGLTATDKIILKNKGLAATKENAQRQGLL